MQFGNAKPARILCVDDDKDFLESTALFLISQGFHVDTADHPRRAMRSLHRAPPDLVLLDLDMPDHSGLEVLRWMRARSCLQNIPAVLLTGRGGLHVMQAGFDAGLDDYLNKPCHPPELVLRLQALLRRHPPGNQYDLTALLHGLQNGPVFRTGHRTGILILSPKLSRTVSLSELQRWQKIRALLVHHIRDRMAMARSVQDLDAIATVALSGDQILILSNLTGDCLKTELKPLRRLQQAANLLWYRSKPMDAGARNQACVDVLTFHISGLDEEMSGFKIFAVEFLAGSDQQGFEADLNLALALNKERQIARNFLKF